MMEKRGRHDTWISTGPNPVVGGKQNCRMQESHITCCQLKNLSILLC
jgi:hypothetical protein